VTAKKNSANFRPKSRGTEKKKEKESKSTFHRKNTKFAKKVRELAQQPRRKTRRNTPKRHRKYVKVNPKQKEDKLQKIIQGLVACGKGSRHRGGEGRIPTYPSK